MGKYVRRKKFPHRMKLTSVDGISIEVVGDQPSSSIWKEFQTLYKPVREWIIENCVGNFSIFLIDDGFFEDPIYIGYYFCFEQESDLVAFKLKWGT